MSRNAKGPVAEHLGKRVLLMDGAIGTEIYNRGVFINRSYDEINLTQPDLVRTVHKAYLSAGAEVLTTNTFGSNRFRLHPFGLEDQRNDIAAMGVRLAVEVADERAWVAASIGPTGAQLAPIGPLSPGEVYKSFREQAAVMAEEGADLFVLETFSNIQELWQAYRAARSAAPQIPILACLTFEFGLDGKQVRGTSPEDAARTITGWGADAMGANCSTGPQAVLSVIERMSRVTKVPLVASPNAGMPQIVEGRTLYMAAPEYMAEYARRFVQKGATVVGGCCGTTPDMIREMRSFVRSVSPGVRSIEVLDERQESQELDPIPAPERSTLAKKLSEGRFCISVELDPPKGLDPSRSIKGAAYLRKAGIDVINIADGPRAIARMGPTPMAELVRQDCGMESVIHFCCRDRNLLGMQMDLLGAHALGLRNILAVTGDPPKMGTYPDATAVFDIDSIGLISFIQRLNRGLDFSGSPLGGQTSFFVGAGCNPAHMDPQLESDRFHAKVEAGAEYFFSQPVYDSEVLFRFLEATSSAPQVPFFVGILPLASAKNAEFLHNEVPGMQVPQSIRDRLAAAESRESQREIGIEVARKTLKEAVDHPRIQGAYIYPPFGSYKAVLRVLDGVVELTGID